MQRIDQHARTIARAASIWLAQSLALLVLFPATLLASDLAQLELERRFTNSVAPFLETYCITCHGPEKPKADLDLSPYSTMESVVRDHPRWELVLEKLQAAEMPPEKAKRHPSTVLRQSIVDWIQDARRYEGEKNAGDPGPVPVRRLSNAEYDYTIRDLTGVDIRPTREFPVDPANQAGFDNSGESLAMSPALLKKYLQAARTVAEHLALKPDGFEFAPHPVVADTDRDKFAVLRIVDFYKRQPTDYADYFMAAWRYRNRVALGRANASLADIADESKVSSKYLATIWVTLTEKSEPIGPIPKLQALWRELPAGDMAQAGVARQGCDRMRDFVVRLREKIVPEVNNLTSPTIQNGSQTLVLWKNRRMAANRRRYDPGALQIATAPEEQTNAAPDKSSASNIQAAAPEAAASKAPIEQAAMSRRRTNQPPSTPRYINQGGVSLPPAILTTGSSATFQLAAAKKHGTGPDPDLVVPAEPAERARYEAAFARFADVFPDAFYITERARVYLDAEKERENAGRLLSAGLHSMTGYFRDDGPLYDLILDEQGQGELDRLWQEFHFAASIPQRMHTSFVWFERTDSSFMRDPEFDPFRPEDKSVTDQAKIRKLGELYLAKAIKNNASETVQRAIQDHFEIVAANILRVEQERLAAEPTHLQALLQFAERAYRRSLSGEERNGLLAFYRESRDGNGLDHEEALRDSIQRVLMSPNFCYRSDLIDEMGKATHGIQNPGSSRREEAHSSLSANQSLLTSAATGQANSRPLSDYALASRLSYFLWSSMPDAELLAQAAAGDLNRPEVLAAHARRMLKDSRIRNFAREFGGHWLDFRRFEEHNAVDRERFPAFNSELRQAMFEEPIRFIVDLVREDRSVLDCLYADYTFVNAPLAKLYGMPFQSLRSSRRQEAHSPSSDRIQSLLPSAATAESEEWLRVEHADKYGRGGLLPMAVFLTANSPGLRTSPVKRGYWVVRRVLGERIPPPPAVVPELPNDEKNLGDLTLRETLAKHREDKTCAGCHARFDSLGLVFEGYGPVGERRETDFGGRPVDAHAIFPGGSEGSGLGGLLSYVRAHRENDFVDNLCRKLVAYGFGRTLLPSDDPLIKQMHTKLAANGNRFDTLIECIVTSPQFRTKRIEPERIQSHAQRE
jgi:hypothetical protein